MWPFHYLLPTVKFLSSSYPKACSPPPGRQLLLPRPRTLSSSGFCAAAGQRAQEANSLLAEPPQSAASGKFCSTSSPASQDVPAAEPAVPLPPTQPLPAPWGCFPQLCPATPFPPCCLCPTSTLRLGSAVPSPDCPSFLNLQRGLQLWFPMPGPSPVSCLVFHYTAYPPDFLLSSFFFPCTGAQLCLLSARSLPTSLNIKLIPSCSLFLSVSRPPTIMSQISTFHTRFYLPFTYNSIYLDLPDTSFSFPLSCQFTRSLASVSWPRVARSLVILGDRSMFWRLMAQHILILWVPYP